MAKSKQAPEKNKPAPKNSAAQNAAQMTKLLGGKKPKC